MNQTHLHLLITHLPIIGSILGAFVLIHGIWKNSNTTLLAAYNIFLISAIGAGVAYLTGESAEETVEDLPGISKNLIEEHSDSALIALICLIVVAAISLAGLYVNWKKPLSIRPIALVALIASLIAFCFVARTGYLGGQIRHTEIGTGEASGKAINPADND